ncbi:MULTISPECIES: TetR family transcriptional regulator [Amycolatopsis]|uniref:DNA-binding transcriptional regulator, AcrR family n=2 Tax=Amycolatopsis TaxID=1813 RepID=A0A1I3ZTY3_9PSEU|nr:TetR family transcriptional regulator [Amycolatopsis sacchari]SFK47086.1 DNA-binding transcriptional regulator, AcrR family [Amycolatopsis sacchari]
MGRWEPNTRQRLELAALELFAERGYESTTVAEITERAGVTKRTFFRYFADKREVLFSGQEALSQLFTDAIEGAPESATPIEVMAAGLDAVSVLFPPERLELVRRRQAIIAANTDLQERELLKLATVTTVMAAALGERGLPGPVARLTAEVGSLAFTTGFARWIAPDNNRPYAELAREALEELRVASAALS